MGIFPHDRRFPNQTLNAEVIMYESGYGGEAFGGLFLLFWVALYLYFAMAQYKIAQKIGHESPWWAWVPILNLVQQVQLSGKDWWWFVLCLVPVVNIFAFAAIWWNIAINCRKPGFWGIMAILPILNLFAWGYLAFTGNQAPPQRTSESVPQQQQPVG